MRDWLDGMELTELAEKHVAAVASASWRIEQTVDVVTGLFEHFLSWTFGAVVELANLKLMDEGLPPALCPEIAGYIRYGVRDPAALVLMTSGIRSRRLAHAIVSTLPDHVSGSPDELRDFLAPLGVAGWRDHFQASAAEILDLLEFARLRGRSLLRALLENGTVTVELPTVSRAGRFGALAVEPERGAPEPAALTVYDDDEPVATVSSQDHADVDEILDTGLGISLTIDSRADPPTLTITLAIRDD